MNFPTSFPAQHQDKHPGFESVMNPTPIYYDEKYIKKGDLLKDKVAIITTAILFGLFHANFSQFFYAVALGMIFAYVTLKTGTIKYSIILHIVVNIK